MGTMSIVNEPLKAAKANPFAAVIGSCDDGQVRRYALDNDDPKAEVIVRLIRDAARGIDRTAWCQIVDNGAAVKFRLGEKVSRPRGGAAAAVTPEAGKGKRK